MAAPTKKKQKKGGKLIKTVLWILLIGAIFNASDVSIVDGSKFVNMLNGPLNYKVINSKDTYVQYTLTVSPEGGEWSDNQQEAPDFDNYELIVRNDSTGEARGYASFDDGWSAAYKMAKDENLGVSSSSFETSSNSYSVIVA